MDEAEQCGRLAFLSRGRLIALGTPEEIVAQFGRPTIEDVFVALQERDEGVAAEAASAPRVPARGTRGAPPNS